MTINHQREGVLENVPIFAGFDAAQLRQIAELSEHIDFEPGQVIVHQGRTSQNLWVLLEGCCEVVRDLENVAPGTQPIVLATLEPYSQFGEMSFFHPAEHSASVRAATKAHLLRLSRARFNSLLYSHPSAACRLACNTIDSLAERMRRMDEWVAELVRREITREESTPPLPEWNELRKRLFDSWTV